VKKSLIASGQYSLIDAAKGLVDYYNVIISKEIVKQISDDIRKIMTDEIEKRRSRFLEMCNEKSFSNTTKKTMLQIFGDAVCSSVVAISNMNKVNNYNGVAGVLLNSFAGTLESVLIQWCNKNSIPSIVLMNGLWPDFYPNEKSSMSLNFCSHILYASEHMKRMHERIGYRNQELIPTGLPFFDNYKNFKRKEPNDKITVLCGFPVDGYRSITFGTMCFYPQINIPLNKFYHLFEVAKAMPNYEFILSFKPWGSYFNDFFSRVKADVPSNVIMKSGNWIDEIGNADVVLSGIFSTVIHESTFLGVPTIVPKINPKPFNYFGVVDEIEWEVENICKAIDANIGKVLDNEEFNNYYFTYNLDGNATNRVVEAVRSICK